MAAAAIGMPQETMTRIEAAYYPRQGPAYDIPHGHDQAGQGLATQEAHENHYTPPAQGVIGYNDNQGVDYHGGHTENNIMELKELDPEYLRRLEWM